MLAPAQLLTAKCKGNTGGKFFWRKCQDTRAVRCVDLGVRFALICILLGVDVVAEPCSFYGLSVGEGRERRP